MNILREEGWRYPLWVSSYVAAVAQSGPLHRILDPVNAGSNPACRPHNQLTFAHVVQWKYTRVPTRGNGAQYPAWAYMTVGITTG